MKSAVVTSDSIRRCVRPDLRSEDLPSAIDAAIVQVEGYAERPDEPNVGFNVIAPGYFATLGTPVLAGREFTDRDAGTGPKVAIVNDSFARHFFGARPPLGRRVTSFGGTYEIVGVVRDGKDQHLRETTLPTMYVSWTQREEADQPASYAYLVRSDGGNPLRLVPALDPLVRAADPRLRVRTAALYETLIDQTISNERVLATLGGLFGTLGLVIAAVASSACSRFRSPGGRTSWACAWSSAPADGR